MDHLTDYSLRKQTPEEQFEVLQSFEKDDDITVTVEEKGVISGPITSVIENGPSEEPEEVHVSFLNYEGTFRDDDSPNHTVSITRTEDGEWEKAELTYSWTDLGRVRKNTVGKVDHVWPNNEKIQRETLLSYEEALIVSLKKAGLSKDKIAERLESDETTIEDILESIRSKYKTAERTVTELESAPIDNIRRRTPATRQDLDVSVGELDWREYSVDMEERDWPREWRKDSDRHADSESE